MNFLSLVPIKVVERSIEEITLIRSTNKKLVPIRSSFIVILKMEYQGIQSVTLFDIYEIVYALVI